MVKLKMIETTAAMINIQIIRFFIEFQIYLHKLGGGSVNILFEPK